MCEMFMFGLGGFSFVVGFLLVFRTSQSYARFWDGATKVHLLCRVVVEVFYNFVNSWRWKNPNERVKPDVGNCGKR